MRCFDVCIKNFISFFLVCIVSLTFSLTHGLVQADDSSTNSTPRLTLSMIVKNEADRYLRRVLESAKEYITDAVIIDDGSDDNTIEVCEEVLGTIPHVIIRNQKSQFSNEVFLRKQQWNETIKTNPDWILVLDADEIFEDSFKDYVYQLMSDKNCDAYYFRLYDFWDEEHYRSDNLWYAHTNYRPFLVRNRHKNDYVWLEQKQHCGRFPLDINNYPYQCSSLRLKHYGWARKEDRLQKYTRYLQLDPEGTLGSFPQYQSILDENPNLELWVE